MAAAEVGDDVYGEDPTVNALEAEVAALFGHEAALFAPTGSMANQIALQVLVPPAQRAALRRRRARRHVRDRARPRRSAAISTRTWPAGRRATSTRPGRRRWSARTGYHAVPTRAIAVEQTHNRGGGGGDPAGDAAGAARRSPTRPASRCTATAPGSGTRTSPTACRWPPTARLFDTLSVCLSKGLGAPVGSVWSSARAERIDRARLIRKRMGGGMRQAGILAAAGLYALAHHIDRLADDHARARPAGRGAGAVRRRGRRTGCGPTSSLLDLTKATAGRAGAGRRRPPSRRTGVGARPAHRAAWSPTWTSTTPAIDRAADLDALAPDLRQRLASTGRRRDADLGGAAWGLRGWGRPAEGGDVGGVARRARRLGVSTIDRYAGGGRVGQQLGERGLADACPAPMFSCRSRVEPHGSLESLACTSRSRSGADGGDQGVQGRGHAARAWPGRGRRPRRGRCRSRRPSHGCPSTASR